MDDQFTEGSKDFFPTNQLVWSNSQTKAKNDIANGAAVIKDNVLYFAGDRTSNNGDAQIGFWLYLGGTGPVSINGNNTFSPPHVDGDLLVLVNFTNGGRNGIVQIYQWDAAGAGNVPNTNGNLRTTNLQGIAAQNNAGNVPVPDGWSFVRTSYDANEFFEGQVDLGPLNLPSLCNASFLLETRSSASITASLDDFVSGQFNITPEPPQTTSPSNCGPWTGNLASLVNCTSSEGAFVRIYTQAEGGLPLSNTQVTVNSTTTYYASCVRNIGQATCESDRVPFTITILTPTSASPLSPAVRCDGSDEAVTFTTTASGTGPFTYKWYKDNVLISGATTNSYTVAAPITLAKGGTYKVEVTGTCGTVTRTATLTVNPNPTCEISGPFASAGGSQLDNICVGGGQTAPTVIYTAPEGNYTYEWTVTQVGGDPFEEGSEALVITAGQGTSSVSIRVSGAGMLKLKMTDKATGCYSECEVLVSTTPNGACTLEGPATTCANTEVTYSAALVEGATYNWTIEGDATFVGSTDGNTVRVRAGASGSYTVYLVVTSPGECPNYCDLTTEIEQCGEPYCTYTQGYYGNAGGIACTPQGTSSTFNLIKNSITNMPNNQLELGLGRMRFIATSSDVDVNRLIRILPGGGSASALTLAPENPGYWTPSTLPVSNQQKIRNILLSQTITLALNAYIPGSNLGSFSLADAGGETDKWLITVAKEGGCALENAVAASCRFTPIYATCSDGITQYISGYTVSYNPYKSWRISSKVINELGGDKTVMDLLKLADRKSVV